MTIDTKNLSLGTVCFKNLSKVQSIKYSDHFSE